MRFGISDRALFVIGTTLSLGVRIVGTMVLARFLLEQDYGRYQLVISSAGLVTGLGDFGVYRFITSRQDLPLRDTLDAAATVTIFLFSIYVTVATLSGVYYSFYYDDPRLAWVGVLTSAHLAATGYYNLQSAALARDLRFARMAGAEVATIVLTALSAIALAVCGAGLFALAVPPLLAQLVSIALLRGHTEVRWPKTRGGSVMRTLIAFGWRNAVFDYVIIQQWNLYYLVVGYVDSPTVRGKEARTAEVGVFGRAVNVCSLFGFNLVLAVDKVVYPLLCKAQADVRRFADLFIRGNAILLAVAGLGAVVLPALGPDLVVVAMGPRWLPAVPYITALSLGLWFAGFMRMSISATITDGKPLVAAAFFLLQLALVVPCAWCYSRFGTTAYCLCLSASLAIASLSFLRYTTRRHQVAIRAVFRRVAPLAVVLLGMGLAMYLTRRMMLGIDDRTTATLTVVIRLVVSGVAGGVVLLLGFWSFDRATLRELRGMITRKAD